MLQGSGATQCCKCSGKPAWRSNWPKVFACLSAPSLRFSYHCFVPWCPSIGFNHVTGDAADFLAKAVLEHAIITDFCGIPLVSLRENSITELDLKWKGVGVPGAIVLSKLLPSAAALTSLKCACRPVSVRLSVSAR